MSDPRNLDPHRAGLLASAFADLPATYYPLTFQLMAMSDEFHRLCAQALEPQLNLFVQSQAPKSLDDYRRVARAVDDITRMLGVCVTVDGEPGVPCGLTADPSTGRKAGFAVMVRDMETRRNRRVRLDADQPWFTLKAAPANVQSALHPLRQVVHATGLGR